MPDHLGRSVFADLMKRRDQARYFAFALLWLDGEDLRGSPLVERKRRLKNILPSQSAHVLYVDHRRGSGKQLFQLVCQLDLEGIVEKKAESRYELNGRNLRLPPETSQLGHNTLREALVKDHTGGERFNRNGYFRHSLNG